MALEQRDIALLTAVGGLAAGGAAAWLIAKKAPTAGIMVGAPMVTPVMGQYPLPLPPASGGTPAPASTTIDGTAVTNVNPNGSTLPAGFAWVGNSLQYSNPDGRNIAVPLLLTDDQPFATRLQYTIDWLRRQ